MTCPYSVPNCVLDLAGDARRCLCGGYVKPCASCPARNRAFARFCRSCGASLPVSKTNWSAYKGSARRLGLNAATRATAAVAEGVALRLRLGDECRSILGYDGHLIAVSLSGVVEVADPLRAKSVCRFQAQGPITAEPCISDGKLYLATRNQLAAYPLAPMTLEPPRPRAAWQVAVDGTPIHALTAVGGRLYVTVASAKWRQVYVVDTRDDHPPVVRALRGAPRMSWIAADPATSRAVFFSDDEGGVQLHVASDSLASHPIALRTIAERPIATLGESVFAVLGDANRLHRLGLETGAVEEVLDDDTQLFALTHGQEEQWDRDGARIDSGGIVFLRSGIRDGFAPHERATKGSPLIVRGAGVVVGMEDGRVRIYDLARLPRHEVWAVADGGSAITALASFDHYIVAGNKEGVVEARELRAAEDRR